MVKPGIELRSAVFGLNTKEVSDYIEKIKAGNEKEITKIQGEIEKALIEKDKLLKELDALSKEKPSTASEEFIYFAMNKVHDFTHVIKEKVASEVKSITELSKTVELEYDKRIAEKNRVIRETKKNIGAILRVQLKKNDNMINAIENEYDQSIDHISEIYEENMKSLEMGISEKTIVDHVENSPIEPEQEAVKEEVIEQEITKEEEHEHEESVKEVTEQDVNGQDVDEDTIEYDIAERSFWEDESTSYTNEDSKPISDTAKNEKTDKDKYLDKDNESITQNNTNTANEKQLKSNAVSNDIVFLRNKYMVGKLAGEDLFDSKGELIIKEGQVINEQIIERSDREGKLSDLIVNMTAPGIVK